MPTPLKLVRTVVSRVISHTHCEHYVNDCAILDRCLQGSITPQFNEVSLCFCGTTARRQILAGQLSFSSVVSLCFILFLPTYPSPPSTRSVGCSVRLWYHFVIGIIVVCATAATGVIETFTASSVRRLVHCVLGPSFDFLIVIVVYSVFAFKDNSVLLRQNWLQSDDAKHHYEIYKQIIMGCVCVDIVLLQQGKYFQETY